MTLHISWVIHLYLSQGTTWNHASIQIEDDEYNIETIGTVTFNQLICKGEWNGSNQLACND